MSELEKIEVRVTGTALQPAGHKFTEDEIRTIIGAHNAAMFRVEQDICEAVTISKNPHIYNIMFDLWSTVQALSGCIAQLLSPLGRYENIYAGTMGEENFEFTSYLLRHALKQAASNGLDEADIDGIRAAFDIISSSSAADYYSTMHGGTEA